MKEGTFPLRTQHALLRGFDCGEHATLFSRLHHGELPPADRQLMMVGAGHSGSVRPITHPPFNRMTPPR